MLGGLFSYLVDSVTLVSSIKMLVITPKQNEVVERKNMYKYIYHCIV